MASLSEICQQRLDAQLTNKPPPRTELQPSPYILGFTQKQLDMRRKAEILEYSAVKQNTKTNKITKQQKWSHFIRNGSRVSQSAINRIVAGEQPIEEICPDDRFIPKPTTASGIPGPIMDLVYDPNVPLYNYRDNALALGIETEENPVTLS